MRQINSLPRTLKGTSRSYRKTLRSLGCVSFPKQGAFHVRAKGQGVIPPEDVAKSALVTDLKFVSGPAPETPKQSPRVTSPIFDLSVPFKMPDVFRRIVREGPDKRRTEYKPVKNPKSGESYFVKREVSGKMKWVERTLDAIIAEAEESAIAV